MADARERHDRTAKEADNEEAVLAKIAAMPEPYRAMGGRIHELVLGSDPGLRARLWYGMPGYAKRSGPVLCFFRVDARMTFGLTEKVEFELDEDAPDRLMACAWFLTSLDAATEARLAAIVRRSVRVVE